LAKRLIDVWPRMPFPGISLARRVQVLAEALPYIQSFHGRTFVITYGGNAMASHELKAAFASDVALLRLVGMSPIVVHGGEAQITDLLDKMGVKSVFHRGMRVTDDETMKVVKMVLGELNQEIVGLINQHGGKAVGLSGQDGHFIHARKMVLPPEPDESAALDLGLVGDIERIDPGVLHLLRSGDFIPVVIPIGVGAEGEAYNIDADVVAVNLAQTLRAEKLILMTDTPGLIDTRGRLITGLTAREIEKLLTEGAIRGGMLPQLNSALEAVKNGVRAAHIIDGRVPNALLLEVLTSEGVGTAIRSDAGPHFLADTRRYFSDSASAT
jgi:acetylglutamate kinase